LVSLFFSSFIGCTGSEPEISNDDDKPKAVDEATVVGALKGDLTTAEKNNKALLEKHPNDSNVLVGEAYLASMRGDTQKADSLLSSALDGAEDKGAIKLRQAIVELQAEEPDMNRIKELADASGKLYGSLLQAELIILYSDELEDPEAEQEKAKSLLEGLLDTEFRSVAQSYLDILKQEDGFDHASPYAAWALGRYKVATANFEFSLQSKDSVDNEALLLWTGRAIQQKEYERARTWLKSFNKKQATDLQKERGKATRALLDCLQRNSKCTKISRLKINSGLLHATKLTAVRGLIDTNPSIAKKLLEGTKGSTAAYYWYRLGDQAAAVEAAAGSDVMNYLE